MYLHIGGSTVIDTDDIIVMLTKESTMMSRDTRRALDHSMGAGGIRTATTEPQDTYIIVSEKRPRTRTGAGGGKTRVYSSPISAVTLAVRGGNNDF